MSVAVSQLGIEPQGVKQAMEIARDPAAFLITLALLAGLAPLVEELVFRGLLYGWIESRWGSGLAFVVSSLAFAAAHVEPAHVVLVLPLGLMFGCCAGAPVAVAVAGGAYGEQRHGRCRRALLQA